ncbi:MAG: hypothetical protein ACYC9L_16235 [Sulfuricaulis sp.]
MTQTASEKQGPMLVRQVSIRLDSPLGREEAKSRGIAASLSRLVICGEREVLAELIDRCCPHNKTIFIHAIGQFVSPDNLFSALDESNMEIVTDHDFLSVKGKQQIDYAFSHWKAEILAGFFADQATANLIRGSLQKLHQKWWKFSHESYEAPYLKQLQRADPYFFFSSTRSALEVIGSEYRILECFDRVREGWITPKT